MWLLLLIALIDPSIHLYATKAAAMETSDGPASPEAAALLWKDGRSAFENGNYQDAVNNLQRLVDRYPGYDGYLEAHRYLGRALMMLGRNEEALKPLRAYVDSVGNRELGLRTKLWLGENYLVLKRPNEAYLLSVEIEKGSARSAPELYAESQFLKARSLMALNHDDRALKVLDSVEATPAVQSDATLKGHAADTRIMLKLRSCARLPARGPMNESQATDQFARRAICLQEALVLFRNTAESIETLTGDDAGEKLYQGFAAYSEAIRHPPSPPKMKPVDRTETQKKQYAAELTDHLEKAREKTIRDSLASLEEWKEKASSKAVSAYAKLSKKIETLL